MKKHADRFKLTPEQFEVDDAGRLMIDSNRLAEVTDNCAYDTLLPEEAASVSVTVTIKF